MHRFFAATGRLAVRFRWAVVVAWVAAAVLANLFFPSLTSVARQNNTSSLAASSPSLQAARLATPFQDPNETPVPVVVVRSVGRLTTTDVTAVDRLAARELVLLCLATLVSDGKNRLARTVVATQATTMAQRKRTANRPVAAKNLCM